jgi:predicted Zn-dependent protease
MTTVQTESEGIQAAMVMINGTQSFCPGDCIRDTRISARKTFAHELGHFIGLSHTENPNDIMFPDASPGGNINHLSVDVATLKVLTGNE